MTQKRIPSFLDYEDAVKVSKMKGIDEKTKNACNIIMYGFSCNERVSTSFLTIVRQYL